jgi:hypothetical protein
MTANEYKRKSNQYTLVNENDSKFFELTKNKDYTEIIELCKKIFEK